MGKNKNNYFELLENQTVCCEKAANLLSDILCNYSPDTIVTKREEMHAVEHAADELHHDIVTRLSREFITPFDQEDILRLVQIVDDITDALDEAVMELYMFHVTILPAAAPALAKTVLRCVKALRTAMGELKSFKKPDKLRSLLVEVNSIEGEADTLYEEATYALFASDMDNRTLFGSKSVYDSLENCCDLCEHATDVIEQVIIKNT